MCVRHNQSLTLEQCLQLDSRLPGITAAELAGPSTELGLSYEQAQLYIKSYTGFAKPEKLMVKTDTPQDEAEAGSALLEVTANVKSALAPGSQLQLTEQVGALQVRLEAQEALLMRVLGAIGDVQATLGVHQANIQPLFAS